MDWKRAWSGRWAVGLLALVLLTHCGGDVAQERVEAPPMESRDTALRPAVTGELDAALPPECLPRLETFEFNGEPEADAYVSRDAPDQGFGGEPVLRVDGSPRLESYLRFGVRTDGMRVRNATLELTALDSTSSGPRVYRTSDDWSEDVTWNTRPSLMGRPLDDVGRIRAGARVPFDVTKAVTSEGTHSFGLIPQSSHGVDFSSREVSTPELRPNLRVTVETSLFCSYRGSGGGQTKWKRQYGGPDTDRLVALATLPEGGFITVGRFGDAVFPEAEEGLAFARYTGKGRLLWTRVVATEDVRATAMALTPSGDIFVVGLYEGSPDLGAGSLPPVPEETGRQGLFLARFSPTGVAVWSRGFIATDDSGAPQPVSASAVAVDADGNAVITGDFQGRMDLGGGALSSGPVTDPSQPPPRGGFLARYFPGGQNRWSRAFEGDGSAPTAGGSAVALDEGDNLLVGGRTSPLTDLGNGPVGEFAPFIAKYTPEGQLLWTRLLSGALGSITSVSAQGPDRVVFAAGLAGTFTFAGQTFSGLPFLVEGFFGALTRTGADVWIRDLGASARPQELAVSPDGALTLLGRGFGEFDVGGGPLGVDERILVMPFVARYSPEGEHRWSRAFAAGFAPHLGLPPGGVLLGGDFGPRPIEVDGRVFTSRGPRDLLFLELTSSPEDGTVCPARSSLELRALPSELICYPYQSSPEESRPFRYELRNTGAVTLYGAQLSSPRFGRACLYEDGRLRFTDDPLNGLPLPPVVTCQFNLGPGERLTVGATELSAPRPGEDVLCNTVTATASDACGKVRTDSTTALSQMYGWADSPGECAAASPHPRCPCSDGMTPREP
ncbi:hypothetical protein KH5H1_26410 [Corallococcus caeni]|uniref:CBM96 family carbohydrate-binding protein n=1 Tax=Corallococcus caeni TaxID=3082388 RepID=UPI0029577582|nr:hypothetical protein KH5H1_26410 [Corallococcus sp. KH5-1]